MGKSRKDYEKYLNSISPDRDDEAWGGLDEDNNPITGGESKNGFCSPFAVNVYIIENDEGVQVAQIDDVDIIECV